MTVESQTIHPRHRTASLIVLILAVIGLLCLLYGTTVVAATFRHIFEEFLEGRRLPTLTHVLLSITGPLYALCIGGAIAGLIWKESRITDNTRTLVMNIEALVVVVFLFMVWVVAHIPHLFSVISSELSSLDLFCFSCIAYNMYAILQTCQAKL